MHTKRPDLFAIDAEHFGRILAREQYVLGGERMTTHTAVVPVPETSLSEEARHDAAHGSLIPGAVARRPRRSVAEKVAGHIRDMPPSGIRRFFELVIGMDDVVSLGVGEPDFKTPLHI